MPIYHFNVHDGSDHPDSDGTELPNLEAARVHAVAYAGQLLIDHRETFWSAEEWKMVVTDANGLTLLTLMFIGVEAPAARR